MTRSCTMGGGSIGLRSAASESERTPFHGHRKKKEKKKIEKWMRRRHTPNAAHPSLLRLLSYAEIIIAGPVHCRVGWGEREFIYEGQGGKRDLNSGLGRVLKYLLTTAINKPIQINRKLDSIPRTRPQVHHPGSNRPCAFPFFAPTAGAPALATPPIYSRSLPHDHAFRPYGQFIETVHHPFPFILPYFAFGSPGPFSFINLSLTSLAIAR